MLASSRGLDGSAGVLRCAWISLGFFLSFLVIRLVIRQAAAYRHNRYRRQALKLVSAIEKDLFSSGHADNLVSLASSLPALLKQTAITAFGRKTVAGLNQNEWIAFLNASAPGVTFSPETAQVLTTCAYGSFTRINALHKTSLTQFINLIKKWIKTHKKELKHHP